MQSCLTRNNLHGLLQVQKQRERCPGTKAEPARPELALHHGASP